MQPDPLHEALFSAYGPQGWWPATTVPEMMVGAVLVQNTAWTQAAKAVAALRAVGGLDFSVLRALPDPELWALIRAAGFFRVKARRLKALAAFMAGLDDRPERLFQLESGPLRAALLGVHGIGKETADSILCYAASRPVFVVDAYTKRLFLRLGWVDARAGYDEMQTLVRTRFAADARQLGEFHALIVRHAKERCRVRPLCAGCPVSFCPHPPGVHHGS